MLSLTDRDAVTAALTDPTLDQWEHLELKERKLTPWEAHLSGLRLSLATRTTLPARIANLDTARQQRATTANQQVAGKGRNDWTKKFA